MNKSITFKQIFPPWILIIVKECKWYSMYKTKKGPDMLVMGQIAP